MRIITNVEELLEALNGSFFQEDTRNAKLKEIVEKHKDCCAQAEYVGLKPSNSDEAMKLLDKASGIIESLLSEVIHLEHEQEKSQRLVDLLQTEIEELKEVVRRDTISFQKLKQVFDTRMKEE